MSTFAEVEREGWNDRAGVYEDTTALATTQAIPSLLAAVHPRYGDRLLDICTGPGFAAGAADAMGCVATGVDFAKDMVSCAKANFTRCSFVVGDAQALDFDDEIYDHAICNFGVFHFTEPEKAFHEAWRVLKAGGRYAWSQWLGPDKSEFFAIVLKAITGNANMDVDVPPAPPPFRLSDPETAKSEMAAAGFTDMKCEGVPIVLPAPADTFMDFLRKFAVRTTLILEQQEPNVIRTIEAEIASGLERFGDRGVFQIPMPAIVVSGQKPL